MNKSIDNFVKLYEQSLKQNWDLPAFTDYAERHTITYGELAREIAYIHSIFAKYNLKQGEKVAIVGRNNRHWCAAFLATVTYGAVVVPILQDFHVDNIIHIIHHSDASILFTNDYVWDYLEENQIPNVQATYSLIDLKCLHQTKNEAPLRATHLLQEAFEQKYSTGFGKECVQYAHIDNQQPAMISYTAGTTGFSKGVILTGENLMANISYIRQQNLLFRSEQTLSFLPMAHTFACLFDLLYPIAIGAHTTLLGKIPSIKVLLTALQEVKPKLIVCVPLILERIYRKQIQPQLAKRTVKFAMSISFLEKTILSKMRQKLIDLLGGNFREVIIGTASLNPEVAGFLYKQKFPFTVLYGLTECGSLATYHNNKEYTPSSCGKTTSDYWQIRIDSDAPDKNEGEIHIKGSNVMQGYYKNEDATKTAFTDDGWLRTGDLGTVDAYGNLRIRGRSKSMILGANGQHIFPGEIESKINNLPYVRESIVVQRNGKLVALVYPDFEAMNATGVTQKELSSVMNENKLALNESLAGYEMISAIQIYPSPFEKTPKRSIRRFLYEM